jgi:hypothetical protein
MRKIATALSFLLLSSHAFALETSPGYPRNRNKRG